MSDATAPSLEELLVQHREELVRRVRRVGRGLLRYETAEDLAQGVQLRALQGSARFEFRGKEAFSAWLSQLIRRHVADRHEYWTAARRNGGSLVRITGVGPRTTIGGFEPSVERTGPFTFAERRDQLDLAAQAVDSLLPRDQTIVSMLYEDASIREIAERLEISYDAAERARLRAIERFRRAYEILAGGPSQV